jgi:hypothetical protein
MTWNASFTIEMLAQTDDANCACDPTGAENPSRTLAQLRAALASRMGYAANIAGGGALPPGLDTKFNNFLSDAQQYLYRRYRVLRTERFFTWQLTAGERFYDIADNLETCPVKLDPRSLTWVGVQRNGLWYDLDCGIPPELYTFPQQSFPRRYEIRECIELELVIRGMVAGAHQTRRYIPGEPSERMYRPLKWTRADGTVIVD